MTHVHRGARFVYHAHMSFSFPSNPCARSLVLIIAAVLFAACGAPPQTPPAKPDATENVSSAPYPRQEHGTGVYGIAFVDEQSCAECHEPQFRGWLGSDHDMAMTSATEATVKGDFNDTTFTVHGITTRFYRDGEKFMVATEGPDGKSDRFEIAYTFGVEPLQQYLIAFPKGRLQTLSSAWNTEQQRWFTLYPDEKIPSGDPLHWTGRYQAWNVMCAECHSTNLRNQYDLESDTFKTVWDEINVSCQACHGPGEKHVAWARTARPGKEYEPEDYQLAVNLKESPKALVEQCARCHSRRHAVSAENDHGGSFLDHYVPETLRNGLYYADGQIREEVYVYGSFVQSKMYHAGVSCLDCHDPHTQKLRLEGNALCTSCHTLEPPTDRFPILKPKEYDTPDHHHHEVATEAARCVNCHMPERTYMQVDARRDHSLRIPRPELTVDIGTPNACTTCHEDQTPDWALAAVETWYSPRTPTPQTQYARAVAAANRAEPGSQRALLELAQDPDLPSIYRASAVERVTPLDRETLSAILNLTRETDPLVRLHAIRASSNAMQMDSVDTYMTALTDSVRAVRFEAARVLASYPPEALPKANLDTLGTVLRKYEAALEAHADMPGNRFNLGILHASQGRRDEAVNDYRAALAMDPFLLPVRFNLAGTLNALGRNTEAEQVLREGLERHPDEGELYYSLGLLLAEDQRWTDAATALGQAARRIRNRPRVWYNYALALQQAGDLTGAESAYQQGLRATPDDTDLLYATAVFYLQQDRIDEAQVYAESLVRAHPTNPDYQVMLETIRRQRNPQ